MAEKVLSLSTTEFDRPIITIDGAEYKMRAPEELTVAMQKRLEKAAEGDDAELANQVRIIMADEIPAETLDKLGLVQLGAILRVFTQRLYQPTPAAAGTSPTPESSPSPAVSGSSAAH